MSDVEIDKDDIKIARKLIGSDVRFGYKTLNLQD